WPIAGDQMITVGCSPVTQLSARTRSASSTGGHWPSAGVTQRSKPCRYTQVTAVEPITSASGADLAIPVRVVPRELVSFFTGDKGDDWPSADRIVVSRGG